MKRLKISVASVELIVELFDTPTSKAVYEKTPFSSEAKTWGEEIYFATPVIVSKENNARDVVTPGEIAFWVEGSSIAIGFGKTPISEGNETRLAAKTNIWAKSLSDVKELAAIHDGDPVKVERDDS